jgi:hypothetical protein
MSMEDFPWNKEPDQKTLAKEYAESNNLDLAETEKKFEEARLKVIYETNPILDPNFESSDSDTDI